MKNILLIAFLICGTIVNAQKTYVPDDNFEQKLIDFGYDDILDDSVLTVNIESVIQLDINSSEISDLTGVEGFTNLKYLFSNFNELTELDVSNNLELEVLMCAFNQLSNLDVSNNSGLKHLSCEQNQLTTINTSNNSQLDYLRISNNLLTHLDIQDNPLITFLDCSHNLLTTLNLANGNNATTLNSVTATGNDDLFCIQVDDAVFSSTDWPTDGHFYFDEQASFNENCNYNIHIQENELNLFTVYPNPTTDFIHIELDHKAYCSLYSIQGKEILSSRILEAGNTVLDVSYLDQGIYLFKAITEEGITISKKIIKQ